MMENTQKVWGYLIEGWVKEDDLYDHSNGYLSPELAYVAAVKWYDWRERGEFGNGDIDIEIVQYSHDDDGNLTIYQRIPDVIEWDEGYSEIKEHGYAAV